MKTFTDCRQPWFSSKRSRPLNHGYSTMPFLFLPRHYNGLELIVCHRVYLVTVKHYRKRKNIDKAERLHPSSPRIRECQSHKNATMLPSRALILTNRILSNSEGKSSQTTPLSGIQIGDDIIWWQRCNKIVSPFTRSLVLVCYRAISSSQTLTSSSSSCSPYSRIWQEKYILHHSRSVTRENKLHGEQ